MDKIRELRDSGLSAREADIQAHSWLNTQAALHNPDLIAGGNLLQVDDVGDKGINSSIGAQWKYRISTVDRHVQSLANNMTEIERKSTYLNVKLKY